MSGMVLQKLHYGCVDIGRVCGAWNVLPLLSLISQMNVCVFVLVLNKQARYNYCKAV